MAHGPCWAGRGGPRRAPSWPGAWPHGRAAPPQSSHPGATGPAAGTGEAAGAALLPNRPSACPTVGSREWDCPHPAPTHPEPHTGTGPAAQHPPGLILTCANHHLARGRDACGDTGSGTVGTADGGSGTVGTEAVAQWGWRQWHSGDRGSGTMGTEAMAQRRGTAGMELSGPAAPERHRSLPSHLLCSWLWPAHPSTCVCVWNHLHGRCVPGRACVRKRWHSPCGMGAVLGRGAPAGISWCCAQRPGRPRRGLSWSIGCAPAPSAASWARARRDGERGGGTRASLAPCCCHPTGATGATSAMGLRPWGGGWTSGVRGPGLPAAGTDGHGAGRTCSPVTPGAAPHRGLCWVSDGVSWQAAAQFAMARGQPPGPVTASHSDSTAVGTVSPLWDPSCGTPHLRPLAGLCQPSPIPSVSRTVSPVTPGWPSRPHHPTRVVSHSGRLLQHQRPQPRACASGLSLPGPRGLGRHSGGVTAAGSHRCPNRPPTGRERCPGRSLLVSLRS